MAAVHSSISYVHVFLIHISLFGFAFIYINNENKESDFHLSNNSIVNQT